MTESEFLEKAKVLYGSRGLRQAKAMPEGTVHGDDGTDAPLHSQPELMQLMMEMWFDNKELEKAKLTRKAKKKKQDA